MSNTYDIIVQRATANKNVPGAPTLKRWAKAALKNKQPSAEITIRLVDTAEMIQLNSTYRHKNKPTNVLSFPFEMPESVTMPIPILGDIVICADVIVEEALQQKKTLDAHWAHMVVHGTLHLLGYDHEKNKDAEIMEAEEISILNSLGFDNPYLTTEPSDKHE